MSLRKLLFLLVICCAPALFAQDYGYYWSATEDTSYDANCLLFNSGEARMLNYFRDHGLSVRLVKDL